MESYLQKDIFNYYPNDTTFWIPIYDTKESKIIQDFILFYVKEKRIEFIEIDNYQSIGASIGYTLLKIKENLPENSSFFIYRSVYLINPICQDLKTNYIHTNKSASYDDYLGICYINDYEQFWKLLLELYKENNVNKELNELPILKKLSINYIISQNPILFTSILLEKNINFIDNEDEIVSRIKENKDNIINYSNYFIEL